MKKIIIKLLFVFTIILLYTTISSLINNKIHKIIHESTAYTINKSVKLLIIGDSHSERSINPQILKNSINISSSGESLFYTYYKLKHFLNKNQKTIKYIILSFSYHNISKKYQESFLFTNKNFLFSADRYYLYLDNKAKDLINKTDGYYIYKLKYDNGLSIIGYKDIHKLYLLKKNFAEETDINGFGGFIESDISIINQKNISEKINTYFYDLNNMYSGKSQIMIDSLISIVNLCKENNIELYIYNSPLHEKYRYLVPAEAYTDYNNAISLIKKINKDISILDMSEEKLDDKHFLDADHLNKFGASVISRNLHEKFNFE